MKRENMENAITEVQDMYILEAAREPKKRRVRIKWAAVPAVILLLAGMLVTVNAAAPVHLGFYLKAAFGDGYTMLDDMTAMPDNIAVRSSGDEITLELKGIMGDRQVVDVFVDMTIAAGIEIPEEKVHMDLQMKPTGLPWEKGISSYGAAGTTLFITENPDGSTTHSCKLSILSKDGVMASKYLVQCTRIETWTEDAQDRTPIVEGEWSLAFSLNYADLTETHASTVTGMMQYTDRNLPEEEITAENLTAVPVQVQEIRLSPLSIGVYWMVDAEHKELAMGYTPAGMAVHLADGTAIMQKRYDLYGTVQKALYPGEALSEKNGNILITGRSAGGGSNGHEEPYYGHCILTFDAELPVEEVVSITIGGLNIPVE